MWFKCDSLHPDSEVSDQREARYHFCINLEHGLAEGSCCPSVSRSEHQRLSDIFVQKGPYLKMYSTYIRQFDNNVALLDEQCRKNPGFAAVVKEFEVHFSLFCCIMCILHQHLKVLQHCLQPSEKGVCVSAAYKNSCVFVCSQMSPRCASLALKHYLLKPVQRIPQYQLLLTGTSTSSLCSICTQQGKGLLNHGTDLLAA